MLRDDEWVANKPVVEVDHLPCAKRMLGHPLDHVLAAGPFLELVWLFKLRLKDADVLPAVIWRILEYWLAVFVLEVDLVASFEVDVGTKDKLVRVIVNMLLDSRIRKVVRISNILGDVADMTEAGDLIRNVVVIL